MLIPLHPRGAGPVAVFWSEDVFPGDGTAVARRPRAACRQLAGIAGCVEGERLKCRDFTWFVLSSPQIPKVLSSEAHAK